ncbi:MAG: hypothetical protein NT062_28475 [Proteobacteria bacterium]|nr:hypothetical protein [Pseudomonadota bacterium]
MAARPCARRVVAITGAAWAVLLVGVQLFVIDALCKLCLIADGAAILHVVAVLAGARTLRWSWRALAIGPGVVAVVGALALLLPHPAEPDARATTTAWPAYVARAQVPNAVTIVEVVDFECPFCRKPALLFAAPPTSLTPAGCAQLAVDAGCDRARYERDLPAAQVRVDAEMAEARAAGDRALPTMYVGHTRLVGVKTSVDQLAALISTSPR